MDGVILQFIEFVTIFYDLNWESSQSGLLITVTIQHSGQGCGSGSSGSGKFLWKQKLEAVNGYRLRCSTILALNVFLTQNKQLKHTITRVCEASCCRKYPLLNSQKFESTAVC